MKEFMLIIRQRIEANFLDSISASSRKELESLNSFLFKSGTLVSMIQLDNYGYFIENNMVTYKPYFESDLAISYCYLIKAKDIAVATELIKKVFCCASSNSVEIRPVFSKEFYSE